MPRTNEINPETARVFLDEDKLIPKGDHIHEADPVKEGSKTIQVTYVTGEQSTIPWALDIEMDERQLTYTERFIGKEPGTKDLEVQGLINMQHVLKMQITELY